jgi:hypothetical protein
LWNSIGTSGWYSCFDSTLYTKPCYKVERRHSYKKDFSVRHRTPSPTPGPVRGDFKHHYKHPITIPHQRDKRAKSAPTYEVEESHHYRQSTTHQSDLSSMVGPVYKAGKVDHTKHHFTDGYKAPLTREKREEQIKLVGKFFKKEKDTVDKLQQKIVDKAEHLQQSYQSDIKVTREDALKQGGERRQEALRRREEFIRQEAACNIQVEQKIECKTRAQLEAEREEFLRQTCARVKMEASQLSQRHKDEEVMRFKSIEEEQIRIQNEEQMRHEAMLQAEEERKKQEEALKQQKIKYQQQQVQKIIQERKSLLMIIGIVNLVILFNQINQILVILKIIKIL